MGFGANVAHMGAYGGFGYFEVHGHLGGGEACAHQAQDVFFAGGELVGAAKEAEHEGFAHACAGEHEGEALRLGFVCGAVAGALACEGVLAVQRHYGHGGARQSAQGDHAAFALGGFCQGVGQLADIGRVGGGDDPVVYGHAVAAREHGVGGQILVQYSAVGVDDDDAAGQLVQGAGYQVASGQAAAGAGAGGTFAAYVASLGAGQVAGAVQRGAGWCGMVCHGMLASSDEMPVE